MNKIATLLLVFISQFAFSQKDISTQVKDLNSKQNSDFTLESFDVGVSAILSPFSNCGKTAQEQVMVLVQNFGADTSQGFSVSYRVDNGVQNIESFVGTLAPNQTKLFTFQKTLDMLAKKSYNIIANTIFSLDTLNKKNDSTIAIVSNLESVYLDSNSYYNSFESFGDTAQYIVLDNNKDNKSWRKSFEMPKSGKFCINNYCKPAGSNNDWLISPCLELKSNDTYILDYYYNGSLENNFNGKFKVYIGKNIDSLEKEKMLTDKINITGFKYRHDSITFVVPQDGGYHLGFLDLSSNGSLNQPGISIDDIKIRKVVASNVVVSDILSPVNSCNDLGSQKYTVQLTNLGNSAASNFMVNLQVNNGKLISEKFTSIIGPAETMNFTFSGSPSIDQSNSYILNAYTSLSNNGQNYSKAIYVVPEIKFPNISASYQNNFDGENDLNAWNIYDGDKDGNKWSKRAINREFSEQISAVNALSFIYPQDLFSKNDDYAISNCLFLQQGISVYVSFSARIINSEFNAKPGLIVLGGGSSTIVAMTDTIGKIEYTSGFNFLDYAFKLTPSNTGLYYIGFKPNKERGAAKIFLEDLKVSRNVVGIQNFSSNEFNIYPNPSSDFINIEYSGAPSKGSLRILDALGREVLKRSVDLTTNLKTNIDLKNYTNGMYIIELIGANGVYSKPLYIEKGR